MNLGAMTPGDPQTRALSGSRKPQVAELSRPWPEPSVPAYYVTSEGQSAVVGTRRPALFFIQSCSHADGGSKEARPPMVFAPGPATRLSSTGRITVCRFPTAT